MVPESEHQIALRNARIKNEKRKNDTEKARQRREMELKEDANEIAKANSKKVTIALVFSSISLLMSAFTFFQNLM